MRARTLAGLVAFLVTAAGAFTWFSAASPFKTSLRKRTAALVNGQRPFAFRLSGDDRWTACSTSAGDEATGTRCAGYSPDSRRFAAGLELSRDARAAVGPGPDAAWSLAIIDLLNGSTKPAVVARQSEILDSLAGADSANAALRNDLAVAYFARGDAWSLFLGLEQIERAYAADSGSRVIAFNRAMALDRLHLSHEASAAWKAYARRHDEPGWSREAGERISAVEARLRLRLFDARPAALATEVTRDPQHARDYVLDSLLPRWSAAVMDGRTARADSACRTIAQVGELTAAGTHDRSVAGIAQACASGRRAAAAIQLFDSGYALFRAGKYAKSSLPLAEASRRLRALGATSLAGWADVSRGFGEMYEARYDAVDSIYVAVERAARARGDSALMARALWGHGLSAARIGAPAVEYYTRAADLFGRLGEPLNRASMLSQRADVLFLLGRDEEGMRGKWEALALLDTRRDARPNPGAYSATGLALVELGLPAAGIAVVREAVAVVREAASASPMSTRKHELPQALIQLANAERSAGRVDEARAHLGRATIEARAIEDGPMKKRQRMAEASLRADLDAHSAPDRAIEDLSEVIAYYKADSLRFNRAVPLARRGILRLGRGDSTGGRQDIEAAVQAVEDQRVSVRDPLATRDRAAAKREVFEALVGLDVTRGDTAAFLAAERARGNRIAEIPRIEPGRAVLSYFSLPDRLLLWVSGAGGTRLITIPIGRAELRDRVSAADSMVQRGEDDADWRATSRALYALLVQPASRELALAGGMTIVPDDALARLPFAALQDSSGRYIVDRAVLAYAPAARSYRDARPSFAAPVVVGQPFQDKRSFPELGGLPGAGRELESVRRAHPRADVIRGSGATKEAVSRAMQRATVFHFAGHARLVERMPSQSHLVLASSSSGDIAESMLSAEEIARMDLRHLGLAILSACGTTQARSRRDMGQAGLADAFFAAHAGAVISSRWTIDDEGTAELMEGLHAELAGGASPALALARAQRQLMRSTRVRHPLRVWAAFTYEEH